MGCLFSKKVQVRDQPKFGEYHCNSCGRYWTSNLCWPNKYQICKRCRTPSLPYKYRDLHAADYTQSIEKKQEHERDLCQMCQELGHSCGNNGRKYRTKKHAF